MQFVRLPPTRTRLETDPEFALSELRPGGARPLGLGDRLGSSLRRASIWGARAALIVALAGLAHCASEPPKTASAGGCHTDDACAPGVCVNGQCLACRDDGGCGDGKQCSAGRCEVMAAAPQKEQPAATLASAPATMPSACKKSADGSGHLTLGSVHFGFDRVELTEEGRKVLDDNAECLRSLPDVTVIIEGHCDERGTEEYNLALGQQRADAVVRYLTNLGVQGDRLRALSKGKLEPLCREGTEGCYAQNRRVEAMAGR